MPRYYRLNDSGEPIEDAEDSEAAQDRTRVRWSRWMQRNRTRRERVTEFRGGAMVGDGSGISVVSTFMGVDTGPGLFRTIIVGIPQNWMRYDSTRTEARARHLVAIQRLRTRGAITLDEQPTAERGG